LVFVGNVYRIGEFADRVGRSASTVRRWEREGRITAKRTVTGQRYFTDDDVRAALRMPGTDPADREVVVYCRVSSPRQNADLKSQVAAMEQFCLGRGVAVSRWVREIGGGMNLRRPKFTALMDDVQDGRVSMLLVARKDRLARFGLEYLEHVAARAGCEIVVANAQSLSPERELTEDLLAIVATFSCRPYGLREYRKTLQQALTADVTR
jgi:predicted site-specific integrase-resolvase